jgi:hypothetical protein
VLSTHLDQDETETAAGNRRLADAHMTRLARAYGAGAASPVSAALRELVGRAVRARSVAISRSPTQAAAACRVDCLA